MKSLNPINILVEGRKIPEVSREQWFAFLNYITNELPLDTVKDLLKYLDEEELNAIRVTLILTQLENSNMMT